MSTKDQRSPRARRTLLAAITAASLGAAAATIAAGTPAAADPVSTATTPTTATGPTCPATNPPDELVLAGGTPQTAQLSTPFGGALQVMLVNGNGCPLVPAPTGTAITFTAPVSGASATFPASGTRALIVGSDPSGAASAIVTADSIEGPYTILATSPYGTVSFTLTNTAAGLPSRLLALAPTDQTATVGRDYGRTLSVRVLDPHGVPVAGVAITFSLGASTSGGTAGAGASFTSGTSQAAASTNAEGIAVSPALRAGRVAGAFTATATLAGGSGGSSGTNVSTNASAVFHLHVRAGVPATVTPGGADSSQSTAVGTRFPIALAVTVTDADGNPVSGARVTFSAPAHGASGRFAAGRRSARPRTVRVRTDHSGVAVAPPFTSDREAGGYVVTASVGHARPAAFALVNAPAGAS